MEGGREGGREVNANELYVQRYSLNYKDSKFSIELQEVNGLILVHRR